MIGTFPEGYPDELFFSRCARYHERMGYRDMSATARDLFGRQAVSVSVDLPSNLDAFLGKLPPGHGLSSDHLIDSNTLLPFYAPFVTSERVRKVRHDMAYRSGGTAHLRLGILTMKNRPSNFWYCPGCVEDDRERFGETYWHRVHQLPGIQMCPIHEVQTVETAMHLSALRGHQDFVTADKTIGDRLRLAQPNNDPHLAVKLRLARDAAWLLANADVTYSSSNKHRERYLQMCFERGACTYSGGKFDQSFFGSVNTFYSEELLQSFGCSLGRSDNWAQRLVRGHRASQHPIYHLLLLQYLGLTLGEFFKLPEKRLPFGSAPWPCLNRICKHFRQDVIGKYDMSFTLSGRLPRAKFRCECGFIYSRVGPDRIREDRYRLQNYITFGDEWEAYVRQHFNPGRRSVRNLAFKLEVHPVTLRRELARMGIIQSSAKQRRIGSASKWTNGDYEKRERYRAIFLETLKTVNRRTALRKALPTVDGWLRVHDSDWWSAHAPQRAKLPKRGSHVDWHKRDSMIAIAIPLEAQRIKTLPGHPVRFSATIIARSLKVLDLVHRYQEKLPISTQALHEHAETHVDYAVRRIWWAVSIYKELGIIPTKSHLRTKAGITDGMVKQERVIDALNAACQHFQPKLLWCVTEAA
jgi:hypothetical protein